jgi:hypothetical protein
MVIQEGDAVLVLAASLTRMSIGSWCSISVVAETAVPWQATQALT